MKDFLSGIFMIFEDQYGVGDVVDLGEASGTVEAVSLRVTRLRDVNGTVWYVRNGEILRVGNMSQNWARAVLDVTVGYDEDLARVRGCSTEVAHDLWEDEDFRGLIIEEPEVLGRRGAGRRTASTVRVTLKTAPHGAVGGGPRAAPADQGALRPRGHRDPARRSGSSGPAEADDRGRRSPPPTPTPYADA